MPNLFRFNFSTWEWENSTNNGSSFSQVGKGILGGADASKPAASIDGRIFIATDTNVIYRDNGTSWVAIAVSSPDGSKLVLRDANGRAQFVDPSVAADAATKGYVDGLTNSLDSRLDTAETNITELQTNPNITTQTLTDGATINWNMNLGAIAKVTLGGNRTFAAPTNMNNGTYLLYVIQDVTGGRTLTWDAVFKWTGGIAPVLTTAANAVDIFSFVSDGTNMYGTMIPDVK